MRGRVSFANVMSTVAVFIALGGTAVAFQLGRNSVKSANIAPRAVKTSDVAASAVTGAKIRDGAIRGGDVADGSLSGTDVQDDSLTGTDVQDGSLAGTDVQDDSLTGADVDEATLNGLACPSSTTYLAGICIETAPRTPDKVWNNASADCADEGRSLPSIGELFMARMAAGLTLAGAGEWTETPDQSAGTTAAYLVDNAGTLTATAVTNPHAYRCVAPPG